MSLHVDDWETARRFYGDGLGLKETYADDEMGWATFQIPGGTSLAIHTWDSNCQSAEGRAPGTVTGLIVTVDDADAFADDVRDAGGKITDPVQKQPWGPRGGTAADPSGNEFVFSEPSTA